MVLTYSSICQQIRDEIQDSSESLRSTVDFKAKDSLDLEIIAETQKLKELEEEYSHQESELIQCDSEVQIERDIVWGYMLDSQILKEKPYLAVIDFDEKPKIEDFKVDLADRIINKKEMKYFRLPSQESEIEYAKARRENTSLQLLKVIQFVRRNKDE